MEETKRVIKYGHGGGVSERLKSVNEVMFLFSGEGALAECLSNILRVGNAGGFGVACFVANREG